MFCRYVLMGLAFATLTITLPAQTSCPDLAEEVLKLDDFDHGQESFQAAFKAVLQHELEPTSLSLQQKDELIKLVPEIISDQTMLQEAQSALRQPCDVKLLNNVRETLANPLTKKMREMEDATRTPEGKIRAERYVKTFPMQSPRESRLDLIRQISTARHATDFALDILTAISKGFHEELQSSNTETDSAALQALRPAMEERAIAFDFYSYLRASDDEIKAYTVLMANPSMQRYQRILATSVARSAHSQAILLARRLKKEVERMNPKDSPGR